VVVEALLERRVADRHRSRALEDPRKTSPNTPRRPIVGPTSQSGTGGALRMSGCEMSSERSIQRPKSTTTQTGRRTFSLVLLARGRRARKGMSQFMARLTTKSGHQAGPVRRM